MAQGSTCKYYELGNTEMKGSFELAQILTTEKDVDLGSKGKLKKLAGADDQVTCSLCLSLSLRLCLSLSVFGCLWLLAAVCPCPPLPYSVLTRRVRVGYAQSMADHKPWKKHAMRLTMVEKGLQCAACLPAALHLCRVVCLLVCLSLACLPAPHSLSVSLSLSYTLSALVVHTRWVCFSLLHAGTSSARPTSTQ